MGKALLTGRARPDHPETVRNPLDGVSWLRKAAEVGNADAKGVLGQAYSIDKKLALNWAWQKTGLEGNIEADEAFSGEPISMSDSLSLTYLQKNALGRVFLLLFKFFLGHFFIFRAWRFVPVWR